MCILPAFSKTLGIILLVVWACGLHADESPSADRPAEPSTPAEWFGQTIRASQWQSAEKELAGFHVPVGFRVELVASEPQIAKPMNLAFDTKGRLWVTQSVLYPFPANDKQPAADAIVVLEDKDLDGSYESKTTFADGLNIPIGILPVQDGAIAFSIPNLYHLRDTDGDGICDDRKVILGPFDTTRDTHGMVNALRDGQDGWIYACHGFNNISKLQGTDGHQIELTSGTVFRFRPDGSRVELYTQGQVNPFGMTRDKYGFWFTADCHSKPITQLLRGGCYPSFGRPDDGLGFVPSTMEHLHGSTAISGVAYVKDRAFPESFQSNLLSGNVMTCRINRNRLEYFGATAKAVEMPDLLTSDDPWFRPVDLQFGPDGCLYIADFYNKIIGHYEVPLDHPDRDRTSGRIWRIRYISNEQENPPAPQSQTESNFSKPTGQEALAVLARPSRPEDTAQAVERLAAVERLGQLGLVSDASFLLEQIPAIDDRDAILKQAHWIAVRDILGRAAIESERFPTEALFPEALSDAQFQQRSQDLLKVLKAVHHPKAAAWTLDVIVKASSRLASSKPEQDPSIGWLKQALLHAATTVDESQIPRVLELMDRMEPDRVSKAQQILLIAQSQKNRNGKLSPLLADLGMKSLGDAATQWLDQAAQQDAKLYGWTAIDSSGKEARTWPIEPRSLQASTHPKPDQVPGVPIPFWSSLGLSERYKGRWTSSPFPATNTLSFWVAGHDGLPGQADRKENYVRVLIADPKTGEWTERYRAYAPRNDAARYVSLDLSEYSGQLARIEAVDSCGLDSYAWIAIADVSEPGLKRSPLRDQYESLLTMAEVFGAAAITQPAQKRAEFTANWTKLIESDRLDPFCKANLQQWVQGQQQPVLSELVLLIVQRGLDDLLTKPGLTKEGKPWRFGWDWSQDANETLAGLAEAFGKRANAQIQEELVLRWSKHRSSYQLMESLIRRGALSKDALRILPASWWDSLAGQVAERFADLKPEGPSDTLRAAVVQAKADAVRKAVVDLEVGQRVFQERCATCHQLSGQGKLIGPQLDGAVVRTIDRLCEDILWPNRNVDEAFRITNVLMEDGETISGLVLDRTDSSLEIVDQAGRAQRVSRGQIEQEKISKFSLMPGNFEELISDTELASLIGYMKTQQPAPKPSSP